MPPAVLFVCTGNVCRSPMAQFLLQATADAPDLEVGSAGMFALVGEPMDAGSAAALRDLGIDGSAHRGRQFEPWMAAGADLILTAERGQRDHVMTEVPTAFRRVFTMREFVRLVAGVPAGDPRAVVAAAAANRGADGEVSAAVDDILDPFRAGTRAAQVAAAWIADTVDVVVDAFGLRRRRPTAGQPPPATDRPA